VTTTLRRSVTLPGHDAARRGAAGAACRHDAAAPHTPPGAAAADGQPGAAAGRGRRSPGAGIVGVRVWPAPTTRASPSRATRRWPRGSSWPTGRRAGGRHRRPRARARAARAGRQGAPDDPYIAGVRVGQNQPRVVRLVIDLKQPVAPQQCSRWRRWPPTSTGWCSTCTRREARDPLLALMREQGSAEARPRARCDDALGELHRRVDRIEPPAPAVGQAASG
jgi:N-acetylmuramoyl-L-alanine amidase